MPSRKATRPDDKRLKANRGGPRAPIIKSRWTQLLDGDITVEDLDDEEIARGKCRDSAGGFTGRYPKTMPRQIVDGLRREFIKRTDETFQPLVDEAIAALRQVMWNPMAAAPARVRAAEVLLERGLGKVTEKSIVELKQLPFEEDIQGIVVDIPDEVEQQRRKKVAG